MTWMILLMNNVSSLLPFTIDYLICDILFSQIDISTVIGAWSEESLQSE